MESGSRRSRHSSPERARSCSIHHHQHLKSFKKVQLVYYLSSNGLLEHPHSMELTLSPNQPLRLKHVLDRLTALRGSGMLSLYSWSCKRSYKGSYVWYDLGVNDVIHPTDEAEYVLKGSKLLHASSERFQQPHQLSDRQVLLQVSDLNLKRKPFCTSPRRDTEYGEKTSDTNSTTAPHSRCSRGVSTDKLEGHRKTSKAVANDSSKRFLDDGTSGSAASRNSVLFQLIACGSSAVAKAPCMSIVVKKKNIVEKVAAKLFDTDMIRDVSENPRFGNSQSEEKEYFSAAASLSQ